jgi:FkbH-like protein
LIGKTEMKYTDILKRNRELGKALPKKFDIAVLSNVTVNPIKEILEYVIRSDGAAVDVTVGGYDNIVQDSATYANHDALLVFLEAANIIEDLPFIQYGMGVEETSSIVDKVKTDLDFLFGQLKAAPLVLINSFSDVPFGFASPEITPFKRICAELNQYLSDKCPGNFRIIDLNSIYARLSVEQSVDLRFFLSSKALYTTAFYLAYSEYAKHVLLPRFGKLKKALVLDCDNTLWSGVLGEDGPDGIKIFREIQAILKGLATSGVILCLNSKNNPADVEVLFTTGEALVLRHEHIVLQQVNWNDKVSNLRKIAETLNIGLDALVFVDDSDFEIGLVRTELPEVMAIQVPKAYDAYVRTMQDIAALFYRANKTQEDIDKVSQYKTEARRQADKPEHSNIDDYLSSLDLILQLTVNEGSYATRLAQLSQKTNQFNFTTKRYTESDIQSFMRDDRFKVYSLGLKDKYGEYGITGLMIVELLGRQARIDTFVMSCRILGRRVEYKFLKFVVEALEKDGVNLIAAAYIATQKNHQVARFFPEIGFAILSTSDGVTHYEAAVDEISIPNTDFIGIDHAR